MYIFVLNYDPNCLSVALVYFCSWQQISRLLILFLSYNKMLIVDQFYYYVSCACIFLFSSIIQTVWQLCLYIFVLNNKLPDHIYCHCVTIKSLTLIKCIDLSVSPVYFCSQQLSKPSITSAYIFSVSPNIYVLFHTCTVPKYW